VTPDRSKSPSGKLGLFFNALCFRVQQELAACDAGGIARQPSAKTAKWVTSPWAQRTLVSHAAKTAIINDMVVSGENEMRTMAALEAKNRFGELLDAAQREPVTIEKHGRPVAVMVSAQDYQDLETLKLMSLRTEIRKGLDDIEAGRTVDGDAAFQAVRKRLEQ